MAQQLNNYKTLYKTMFDTYQESTFSQAQHSTLHRILMLICSRDMGEILSSWCRDSGPVTHLHYIHQNHQLPWLQILQHSGENPQRTFLTQEEMVLAQAGLQCLLLPKNTDVTCDSSGFFLKAQYVANKPSNKLQVKD